MTAEQDTATLDPFAAAIRARMRDQAEQIDADLRGALGWRARLPKSAIRRLGFQVIYQRAAYSGFPAYRGIARAGVLIVDHYPDMPWEPTGATV